MNTLLTLSRADLRSTFRDPIFKGLLGFPFVAFAIVRYVWPWLSARFPVVAPYGEVLLMWACLQSATMFGMIYGFLFLEEKEDRVWEAIRVLPVTTARLVASRLLVGVAVSTLVNWALIHRGGIVDLPAWREWPLALLFSLSAPLLALLLGVLAGNRIEGLAQMKIWNLVLIVPALIYFVPHPLAHLTALSPTYWAFRSLEAAAQATGSWWTFLSIGFLVHILVIWGLARQMGRRIQS